MLSDKWQIRDSRLLAVNPPTDCRCCGACCFSKSERFVRVTGDDWARLGDAAADMAHFIGNRAYMRMRDGHCAVLEVRSTPDGIPDYFCTLYERRPQICRDLARGSPECEGELSSKCRGTEQVEASGRSAVL